MASLLFWCLIIIVAYTANLTSFLVNRDYVKFDNFEAVVSGGYAICISGYSVVQLDLQEEYPTVNFRQKETELEIFKELIKESARLVLSIFLSLKNVQKIRNIIQAATWNG